MRQILPIIAIKELSELGFGSLRYHGLEEKKQYFEKFKPHILSIDRIVGRSKFCYLP